MHANQADVQKILGGVQQYVVPMFQRPYSWKDRQWATLWDDLEELCDEPKPRNHFIGSIVTMPDRSVPEGVSKFVLIDGQQRITTILLLLAALRDKARREDESKLADKIDDLLLKNRHQDDTDVYKVLPTQADRPAFCAIMDATSAQPGDGVAAAHAYFDKRLRAFPAGALDRLQAGTVQFGLPEEARFARQQSYGVKSVRRLDGPVGRSGDPISWRAVDRTRLGRLAEFCQPRRGLAHGRRG